MSNNLELAGATLEAGLVAIEIAAGKKVDKAARAKAIRAVLSAVSPKHTPGPWKMSVTDSHIYVRGPGRQYITQWTREWAGSWKLKGDEREALKAQRKANATLIAHAPDMLDALKMVDISITGCEANSTKRAHWEDDMAKVKELVREVIRSAEGRM